jgi:hypothetical protein
MGSGGDPLGRKAQATALIVPGMGQHPEPLERARREPDRLFIGMPNGLGMLKPAVCLLRAQARSRLFVGPSVLGAPYRNSGGRDVNTPQSHSWFYHLSIDRYTLTAVSSRIISAYLSIEWRSS